MPTSSGITEKIIIAARHTGIQVTEKVWEELKERGYSELTDLNLRRIGLALMSRRQFAELHESFPNVRDKRDVPDDTFGICIICFDRALCANVLETAAPSQLL